MKKIFTLFGMFLAAGATLVQAENVKIAVEVYHTWDYTYEDALTTYTYDTEITYADGVYTINNFLKSGYPVSFTIARGASAIENSHTFINFVNNTTVEYDMWGSMSTKILKTDDPEASITGKICHLTDYSNEIELSAPYIFNATSDTYVQRAERSDNGNVGGNYFARIRVCDDSFMDTNIGAYGANYNLKFYFNGPEINYTPVTVDLCDESGNVDAEPYQSELSVDANGVYTLSDFLASSQPMSFTFDPNDPNENIAITLVDNVKVDEVGGLVYNYIIAPDAKPGSSRQYLAAAKYFEKGNPQSKPISRPYINLNIANTYVQRIDKEANNGNNYMAFINVAGSGFNKYLKFYFAGPEQTGIFDIEVDNENAPVEFYNLNGQRVENPSNGIFVRKQGSKVEKVVIR